MKKIFLITLFTAFTSSMVADMQFQKSTNTYSTSPDAHNIDQKAYNELVWFLEFMNVNFSTHYVVKNDAVKTNQAACNMIEIYLRAIGTPTALRILADLQKLKIQPMKQI